MNKQQLILKHTLIDINNLIKIIQSVVRLSIKLYTCLSVFSGSVLAPVFIASDVCGLTETGHVYVAMLRHIYEQVRYTLYYVCILILYRILIYTTYR